MKKLFIIFAALFVLAGCATTNRGGSENSSYPSQTQATAQRFLKFDDVPVPAGFNMIDNESFVFQNDRMRVGLLKYSGMPDANQVVQFYKDQMPMYNWDMINIIEYGQKVMNFDRADQTCIITVQPQSMRTVIAIAVAPKAKSAMTEEKVQKYKELKSEYAPQK